MEALSQSLVKNFIRDGLCKQITFWNWFDLDRILQPLIHRSLDIQMNRINRTIQRVIDGIPPSNTYKRVRY